jgi:hypothetical protein
MMENGVSLVEELDGIAVGIAAGRQMEDQPRICLFYESSETENLNQEELSM